MASRELIPPRLPNPPLDFDHRYMVDLVRTLELFINQQINPGQIRGTKITLTNLPTSAVGLEIGDLYRVIEQVKIVILDVAAPDGTSGTGAVGSVTVTTS